MTEPSSWGGLKSISLFSGKKFGVTVNKGGLVTELHLPSCGLNFDLSELGAVLR